MSSAAVDVMEERPTTKRGVGRPSLDTKRRCLDDPEIQSISLSRDELDLIAISPRAVEGERKLAMAILHRSTRDLLDNIHKQHSRSQLLFAQAVAWFLAEPTSESETYPFSFENVARLLGYNAETIKDRVRDLKRNWEENNVTENETNAEAQAEANHRTIREDAPPAP